MEISDKQARRQLAAIMFTDIAGYTALMQTDEKRAMQSLSRYRSTLQEAVVRNGGEVLQHIGDGSLSMFQSTVQAVQCAIELQRALQQEPIVPLRAGMHLGDVVIESDSVYGDGVNVASRIEQLADPGSILISQALYDSIRNQRKFRVKYLGAPKLRNVMDPTKVYAVRNRGVVVPDRLTRQISIDLRSVRHTGAIAIGLLVLAGMIFGLTQLLGNKNDKNTATADRLPLPELVITPLQNHTGDKDLDGLGQLVATQITRELTASNLVQIRAPENVKTTNFYQLKGGYYKDYDVIIFQTMLSDGTTGQIKTVFDPQVSRISEPEESIPELTEQILGFWPVKDQVLTSGIKPPKYRAYREYQKGLEVLYQSPKDAVRSFSDAIAIDAEYLAPRMSIIHAHYLYGDLGAAHHDIEIIKETHGISKGDHQVLSHWEFLINGEYQRAFDTLSQNLDADYDNVFVRMQLARIALEHLLQPRKAIEIITPLIQSKNENTTHWRDVMFLYQELLMKVRRYEQLLEITPASVPSKSDPALIKNSVRALCRLEQHQEVRKLIDECRKESNQSQCRADQIIQWAAIEYCLIGDTVTLHRFVSQGLGMPSESRVDEAMLHYLGEHYNTAAAMYREVAGNEVDTLAFINYSTLAAIAQFQSGDTTLATQWLHDIDNWNDSYRHGIILYQKARILVAAKDHETALTYLEDAARHGVPHRYGYYETDVFLAPLFRENRFLRLTEAKD